MLKLKLIGTIFILFWSTADANAQKATEMFIPIGQSPGLSGKYTVIGKIDATRNQDQTITVTDSTESHTFKVTERTKIWLDRSKLKLTNQKGAFEDLQMGLLVEVKYESEERKDAAKWIKVQANK